VKLLRYILLTLTFAAQNVPAGSTQNLPDMGDSAGGVVTPEYERRLGQAIMRQVRQSTDVITDPEVESISSLSVISWFPTAMITSFSLFFL